MWYAFVNIFNRDEALEKLISILCKQKLKLITKLNVLFILKSKFE